MADGDTGPVRQVVINVLANDATMRGLVAGRVRGAHVQDPDDKTMTYPLIVVESIGGLRYYGSPYRETNLDIWVFSGVALDEAITIYDAAHQVLHAQRLSVDGVTPRVVLREIDGPEDGYNEATGRWFVRATYIAQSVS